VFLSSILPTSTVKANRKPLLKVADSLNHSVKGYADDATLISTNIDTHSYLIKERAADIEAI